MLGIDVRIVGASNEKLTIWIANAGRWYQEGQATNPNDIRIAKV